MRNAINPRLAIAVLWFCALGTGCTHRMPAVDLGGLEPGFLQRCTEGPGVLLVLDERFEDDWGEGYDNTAWLLLGEERRATATSSPTSGMAVRRQVLRILSEAGVEAASTFRVVYYREKLPPVEVHVWQADGRERPVHVQATETLPLAYWNCDLGFPRWTTFRITTLAVGDTLEILTPVCGPDRLHWTFGSDRFCTARSVATFGRPADEFRLDAHARTVDASGGVRQASPEGAYPMVFELTRPLMPLSAGRLPFVHLSPRCPGWENLRGRIFQTALWLARRGDVDGPGKVHPRLRMKVDDGQRARRIQALAEWMQRTIELETWAGPDWLRWIPRQPASAVAERRRGDAGSLAALAFRVLDDAGLEPRLALVATDPHRPLAADIPDATQFDTLAVMVDDENGRTHWLVPGLLYVAEHQPPPELAGRQALVLERWWIERQTGAGSCEPALELNFSCQLSSPQPVEVRLMTIPAESQ